MWCCGKRLHCPDFLFTFLCDSLKEEMNFPLCDSIKDKAKSSWVCTVWLCTSASVNAAPSEQH